MKRETRVFRGTIEAVFEVSERARAVDALLAERLARYDAQLAADAAATANEARVDDDDTELPSTEPPSAGNRPSRDDAEADVRVPKRYSAQGNLQPNYRPHLGARFVKIKWDSDDSPLNAVQYLDPADYLPTSKKVYAWRVLVEPGAGPPRWSSAAGRRHVRELVYAIAREQLEKLSATHLQAHVGRASAPPPRPERERRCRRVSPPAYRLVLPRRTGRTPKADMTNALALLISSLVRPDVYALLSANGAA